MKGVQCRSRSKEQCRDVQADFVCKLEKERVNAFEVYPNTVRLNLLNGCPSRSPLKLCCISFVFIYDYRRFSHISVHSKRKKNSPQHLHELYVFSTDWVVNTRGVKRNLDYKDIHKAFASRKRRKG